MYAYTLFSDLHLNQKNPAVRVKVISKWTTNASSTSRETQMLIGDEKGSTIQGTFHDEYMKRNRTIINEGEWYEIHNFKLIHNFRLIKATKHRYHVITKGDTVIKKIEGTFTCNYYRFQYFKTIMRGLAHPKFCVDIYGSLVCVGDLEYVEEQAGMVKPKMAFTLVNPEYTHIKCIAYGTNALQLDAYWNSTKVNVVLCVLSVWQIERDEGGFRYMRNFEGCSKIVFEPNIPEIEEFRKKIPAHAY